ncbi:FAD-dependent oxidoreductase [Halopseudomonas aestusnigri]|jgi:predicted NAD/FAD-binding protein|uniref:NAD(P)/FAD-dependent oxidoreductase n=1 Tax=Halopseudomonas TaxID=2901189 RepID=UPI000C469073|nr:MULTISPECIES: FAD-dependent oxidoreductase [Halopseudomonas]MAH00635.1 FAD-dependent oxidoreductase [Pseudomonadales bacterium]MEE2798979.1 FAD-dependent oxidoreductase [Pseudomonadota bacterium]HBT55657.1 FAD-dependent oxidoreductase [Pseudomonas sp.]MAK73583.1 FAD-dependent oxidoreductase [Pseudomonadales bacterium]MAP77278.1 FAD-dependent oxidoreductase [Pseudomonadales bacterium]|tara:strand:- start:13363 stop:14610 length:1248 start_codon:yes stop_codon:yes gene_type:complete
MRIAIVGSGIAGLVSAYLLSRRHEVTVFEAGDWIGGHTHTVDVEIDQQRHAIDTGFIVFNDWTYPNFIRLLEQLGVESQPTEMSFSVCDPRSGLEYNGNNLNTLFAQRSNLLSPGFLRMLMDILRFNREAIADLEAGGLHGQMTLGDYLQQQRYSQRFIDHYIVPMGSAIWSMSLKEMLNFPLAFFIRFFHNHGLLSVNDRPQWRVIKGGSRSYIPALSKPFADNIRLDCPVQRIRRDETGVTVLSRQGEERFDRIVLACHSDQALKLLEQPSPEEQAILGDIRYADNDVVLHTDTRLLPSRRLAWASWNYRLGGDPEQPAALTYNMNILQGLDASRTFCVSLNQTDQIDPAQILGRFTYAHPQFSVAASAAQQQWQTLLGKQHTFFCGAWWANGFHEDGVVSALRVASHFGEVL